MSNSAGTNSLITSAATGATSAPMTMINEYAALVGVIVSILSLVVGIYFKLQERRDKQHVLLKSHEALREELKQQLINEIKSEEGDLNDKVSCS